METYFIGIFYNLACLHFEVFAKSKEEADIKAQEIAAEAGDKWTVSYIEKA